MIITVPTRPSSRFHVEAWLPLRNREMDQQAREHICHFNMVARLEFKYVLQKHILK